MFGKKETVDSHRPLKIMIVGCGKVGATLVEQLTQEGNDITLIDEDSDKVADLTNLYDALGFVGNGASYSLQKEAGIDTTDLFIAVTDSDELNLLCCTIAKRFANCAAIARVRKPDYMNEVQYLRTRLGLAMIINPELEAANEIAHILYLPSALEVNSFAKGDADIIKVKVPQGCQLCDTTIAEFTKTNGSEPMLLCAVERDGEVYIPNGSFIIRAGDIVSFVSSRRNGKNCLRRIGISTGQVRDCMIIGGGDASYYLASILIRENISVKIIERNRARCEQLSILLPDAIIICADGTDTETLIEEGLETVEAFVPLTGIDEENVMLTLYAKRFSCAKVITKVNRISFPEVINSLDLGSVIYPRYITAEAIIAYARARRASVENNIETLYHLFNHRVEAIEFLVSRESALTGKRIMDLKLKDNLIIAFISRGGDMVFPTGTDTIEVGDSVLIVTTHSHFSDISDILAQ